MKHVANYSGGEASWYEAELTAEEYGVENLTLLFADVFIESADLYVFLVESAAHVFGLPKPEDLLERARALPPLSEMPARKEALRALAADATARIPGLVWIAEGRTPWEVFRDVRLIGNSRVDPCSRVLKRDFLAEWVVENCDPAETVLHFGLDANEAHRLESVRERHNPHWAFLRLLSCLLLLGEKPLYFRPTFRVVWRCEALLIDRGVFKEYLRDAAERAGLHRAESYRLGYYTNNCAGACVKAGHAQWELTLIKRPEVYAYAESEERKTKAVIGRDDIGVLKDRRGGVSKAMDLTTFRERVEAGMKVDRFDWGGCGCAV